MINEGEYDQHIDFFESTREKEAEALCQRANQIDKDAFFLHLCRFHPRLCSLLIDNFEKFEMD